MTPAPIRDVQRQGDRFAYVLLTPTDRSALRMERAHGLEADLYRLELQLEEAVDNAERERIANRADALLRRLRVHLSALSSVLPDTPSDSDQARE